MRTRIFFSIVLIVLSTPFFGQTPPSGELTYHVSLIANNGIRPGLNLGMEYGLFDAVKFTSKVKRGKGAINSIKVHQLISAFNSGVIWHPETSLSSLSNITLEYRKTTKRRMQWQLGIGGAYMRQFLPNTFVVDEGGSVSNSPMGSTGYFGPTHFIGYGRYRKEPRKLQWWHFRVNATYLIGYNGFLIPYLTSEIRLGFHKKPIE